MNSQAAVAGPYSGQARNSNTVLIVALVIGALTAAVSTAYLINERQKLSAHVLTIYKLSKDVAPGYKIRPNDLIPTKLPDYLKESLPFTPIEQKDLASHIQQPITRAAKAQEVLSVDMFISKSDSIDNRIEVGKRGVPLPINSRTASGIIRPGMHIDIHATFTDPKKQNPVTLPVMEAVRVIAVGSTTEEDSKARGANYSTITVELEPADASAMVQISKHIGREGFDVILRNKQDDDARHIRINEEVKRLVGME